MNVSCIAGPVSEAKQWQWNTRANAWMTTMTTTQPLRPKRLKEAAPNPENPNPNTKTIESWAQRAPPGDD